MSTFRLTFDEPDPSPVLLTYSNEVRHEFCYSPGEFVVSVDIRAFSAGRSIDALRLEIPPSWVSDRPLWRRVQSDGDVVEWRVWALGNPRELNERMRIVALAGEDEVLARERSIEIALRLSSQFDPRSNVISRPNSVAGWGVVQPSRAALNRTFAMVPFRDQFFRGLYRSIVFMNGDGSNPGGLCSGLARAALERSLAGEAGDPSLEDVVFWHGRQLSDRSLLSGAWWLFFGSPRRAFTTFRDDLLRDGRSDRCFDIGVPRPWRRDIIEALQSQGHTVVPYALEQTSEQRARPGV